MFFPSNTALLSPLFSGHIKPKQLGLYFHGTSQLLSALPIVFHWVSTDHLSPSISPSARWKQPQILPPSLSMQLTNMKTATPPFCARDCGRWHRPVYYRIILFYKKIRKKKYTESLMRTLKLSSCMWYRLEVISGITKCSLFYHVHHIELALHKLIELWLEGSWDSVRCHSSQKDVPASLS